MNGLCRNIRGFHTFDVRAVSRPEDYGAVVDPPLPVIFELGAEPYYYQSGYHYFYHNDRWRYSKSRRSPWVELPRSHWPREIRYRDRNERGGNFRLEHEKR